MHLERFQGFTSTAINMNDLGMSSFIQTSLAIFHLCRSIMDHHNGPSHINSEKKCVSKIAWKFKRKLKTFEKSIQTDSRDFNGVNENWNKSRDIGTELDSARLSGSGQLTAGITQEPHSLLSSKRCVCFFFCVKTARIWDTEWSSNISVASQNCYAIMTGYTKMRRPRGFRI